MNRTARYVISRGDVFEWVRGVPGIPDDEHRCIINKTAQLRDQILAFEAMAAATPEVQAKFDEPSAK